MASRRPSGLGAALFDARTASPINERETHLKFGGTRFTARYFSRVGYEPYSEFAPGHPPMIRTTVHGSLLGSIGLRSN